MKLSAIGPYTSRMSKPPAASLLDNLRVQVVEVHIDVPSETRTGPMGCPIWTGYGSSRADKSGWLGALLQKEEALARVDPAGVAAAPSGP
jgi:hypothetical protein